MFPLSDNTSFINFQLSIYPYEDNPNPIGRRPLQFSICDSSQSAVTSSPEKSLGRPNICPQFQFSLRSLHFFNNQASYILRSTHTSSSHHLVGWLFPALVQGCRDFIHVRLTLLGWFFPALVQSCRDLIHVRLTLLGWFFPALVQSCRDLIHVRLTLLGWLSPALIQSCRDLIHIRHSLVAGDVPLWVAY